MNPYIKVIKIAVGSTVAILIAYALGLNYAVSAGIITLLTLQDTKKTTVFVALMRIGAFILAVMVALIVFSILSYNPMAYGVFLFIFVGICSYLKIFDAIPMNAVLATHYLLEESISLAMIANEALKSILSQMAEKILIEDKSNYNDQALELLNEHISIGIKQAYTNMNNTFFQETRYYIEYMEMRKQQHKILKDVFEKMKTLTTVPPQAHEVGDFIISISKSLSESQNAKGLLAIEETLLSKIRKNSLPVTRVEFENRAVLYTILMDFGIFLKMKEEFVDSLTKEQKDRYWKSRDEDKLNGKEL